MYLNCVGGKLKLLNKNTIMFYINRYYASSKAISIASQKGIYLTQTRISFVHRFRNASESNIVVESRTQW